MSFPSRRMLFPLLCASALILAGGTAVATDTVDSPTLLLEADQPSDSVIIGVENSSNYLSPQADNVSKQEYKAASLDVAGAVQGDALRLQGEHRTRSLQDRFDTSGNVTTVATETVRMLEGDVRTLEQQKRQLYTQYSAGKIDTGTLFREVVRLGVTADQYRKMTSTVQNRISSSKPVITRYKKLRGELALLPSPIASHLEAGLTTGGQTPMYVQGGNQSLIMATVEGNTYLRQAVVLSERDRNAQRQFGEGGRSEADDAFARAESLYPWTVSDSSQPEIRGFGNSSVYRFRAGHSHGELQSYIDGGTTNPFFELHEKNPFSVPVTDFTQTTNEGLRLDIQLTNPTGPMRIEVIETGDLDANNITISIGDDQIANLSSGNDFYTIQPMGTFEVTAKTDTGEEVSILVFP
jgi:hypothetical protein